jgi:hypothetical protein
MTQNVSFTVLFVYALSCTILPLICSYFAFIIQQSYKNLPSLKLNNFYFAPTIKMYFFLKFTEFKSCFFFLTSLCRFKKKNNFPHLRFHHTVTTRILDARAPVMKTRTTNLWLSLHQCISLSKQLKA